MIQLCLTPSFLFLTLHSVGANYITHSDIKENTLKQHDLSSILTLSAGEESVSTSVSSAQDIIDNATSELDTRPSETVAPGSSAQSRPRTFCTGPALASPASGFNSDVTQSSGIAVSSPSTETEDPFSKELVRPEAYVEARLHLTNLVLFFRVVSFVINLVNAVVLSQKTMQSPASPYLVALAVAEFAHVCLGFVPSLYSAFTPLSQTSRFYLTYALFVNAYAMVMLGRYTYCLTTLVCCERFFAVALPLQASRSRLIKSPVAVIVAFFVLIFVVHFDIPLNYQVYLARTLNNGEEVYSFRFTDVYAANKTWMEMWSVATKVVFVYAMLLMALLLNVMLVVALRRHGQTRQSMTTSDNADKRRRQEREITLTILVSSTVFTVLALPLASNAVAAKLLPDDYSFYSARCHTYLFVQDLGATLFALSFCTDFFTFVIFSSAYRVTLTQLLARAARCGKWVTHDTKRAESMAKTADASSSVETKNSEMFSMETRIT